jgi:hypothetical protein
MERVCALHDRHGFEYFSMYYHSGQEMVYCTLRGFLSIEEVKTSYRALLEWLQQATKPCVAMISDQREAEYRWPEACKFRNQEVLPKLQTLGLRWKISLVAEDVTVNYICPEMQPGNATFPEYAMFENLDDAQHWLAQKKAEYLHNLS